MDKMALPAEGDGYLRQIGLDVIARHQCALEALIDELYTADFPLVDIMQKARALEKDMEEYTMRFVFLACAFQRLRADYKAAGHSDELYWDTVLDLKSKVFECKQLYGIWGTGTVAWYRIFFQLKIFRLGRLQFEKSPFRGKEPVTVDGVTVLPGQTVYNVHIPSGRSISPETCEDSFQRAKAFFKEDPLVLHCGSWLLYNENPHIFPSAKNVLAFREQFQIYESRPKPEGEDLWRIFGQHFDGDVSSLPQNTSMQKETAAWLAAGKQIGIGFGLKIL
jgi:hypothetical protein